MVEAGDHPSRILQDFVIIRTYVMHVVEAGDHPSRILQESYNSGPDIETEVEAGDHPSRILQVHCWMKINMSVL